MHSSYLKYLLPPPTSTSTHTIPSTTFLGHFHCLRRAEVQVGVSPVSFFEALFQFRIVLLSFALQVLVLPHYVAHTEGTNLLFFL